MTLRQPPFAAGPAKAANSPTCRHARRRAASLFAIASA
jgi:hypothetical protein